MLFRYGGMAFPLLLESGFQTAYHGTCKSGMFHFVQSLDGHATGSRHFINGRFGMFSRGLQKFYGTFHSLQYYLFGILGLEAQLHTAFYRCPYVAHGVGYAAGGKCGARSQQAFFGDKTTAQRVEDTFYGLDFL